MEKTVLLVEDNEDNRIALTLKQGVAAGAAPAARAPRPAQERKPKPEKQFPKPGTIAPNGMRFR